jgi:hypothetical protein
MKEPLVSILIPADTVCCTSEPWVASALSVIAQTYVRFQLLVIGCDEPTVNETNAPVLCDPRIRLVKADTRFNHGHVSEWNAGLRAATGDVVTFIEPGIVYAPHRLERVIDIMYGSDRADAVYGLLFDPEKPESASRAAANVMLRDSCSLLNRNFKPPMGEWIARLAYHHPNVVINLLAGNDVRPYSGECDPEPPDTASPHRQLEFYSGWWRHVAPVLALHP